MRNAHECWNWNAASFFIDIDYQNNNYLDIFYIQFLV